MTFPMLGKSSTIPIASPSLMAEKTTERRIMATVRMTSDEIRNGPSMMDWDRVKALKDEDIDFSDIPEATDAQLADAVANRAARLGHRMMAVDEFSAEYIRSKALATRQTQAEIIRAMVARDLASATS